MIDVGTCVSSCIKVKGFRNVIHWRVTRYDEPKVIEMVGTGRGGVRISLTMQVQDAGAGAGGERLPGARRTDGRSAQHPDRPARREGDQASREVGKSVPNLRPRLALAPFVVHGAGFVARLDGESTPRACAAATAR